PVREDSLSSFGRRNQMRSAAIAVLLLSLVCSPGLLAEVLQTSKGLRLSILHHSPSDGPKTASADQALAHNAGKDKDKAARVAKVAAPKGRVKVRSVAGSRWKKGDRRQTETDSVTSHQ
ncbi:MAG: hypothetical protein PHP75_09965, partial [Methylacidiphilaceae bacterium]|nr:hypothetical protein [Candidatus Methylacidiphilaceae bacterium]